MKLALHWQMLMALVFAAIMGSYTGTEGTIMGVHWLGVSIILVAIGLPAEAIGLLLVVDRLLDMMRTVLNIFSDSVGSVVIAKSEGETEVLQSKTF